MKITVTDTTISVVSPYDANFVKQAKQINGKWDKPAWVFPKENENLVRNLCRDIFGTDGTPEVTETILVNLAYVNTDDRLMVGPIEVLRKWDRDVAPKVGEGCTVVQGSLRSSGGSRNNPRITHSDDCVIRVKNVPQSLANQLVADYPNGYQIDTSASTVEIELTDDEKTVAAFLKTLSPERLAVLLKEISKP